MKNFYFSSAAQLSHWPEYSIKFQIKGIAFMDRLIQDSSPQAHKLIII